MIRLGFIGVGGYGGVHIAGFLPLQAEGLVRITAFADPAIAVLAGWQTTAGTSEARFFSDYRDLLAIDEIDAVVISAPIPLHHEIALAAAERGLFVLLEKPPVPLLSQLDELIAADHSGRVMVAFQHIYSDLIQGLKRELVGGHLGEILSISAIGVWPRPTIYYERSGWAGQLEWEGHSVLDGPCTNALSHYLNIVLFLAAAGGQDFAVPIEVTGEVYRARPLLRSYDTGCLTGSFDGGACFLIGFSHAAATRLPIEITVRGTSGTVSLIEQQELLQRMGGPTHFTDDGSKKMRRAFLAFAAGDSSRNWTSLQETKSYVLTTNLMFFSSGGIHTIPEGFVRSVHAGTAEGIYEVDDLAKLLRSCAEKLVPLSHLAIPWARRTSSVEAARFSEPELIRALSLIDHAEKSTASLPG